MASGLFVPGWGAPSSLYLRGLPNGWDMLESPSFRRACGRFGYYREWLRRELLRRGRRVTLGGHSMGGALSVLAALDEPELVERLVLVSPAGLPLTKTLRGSAVTFVGQFLRASYPPLALCRMAINTGSAPFAALKLAREVHDLDLTPELEQLRGRGVPVTVIGCPADQLVTRAHCRRLAELAGADYRDVDAPSGHIWPITHPALLRRELEHAARLPVRSVA